MHKLIVIVFEGKKLKYDAQFETNRQKYTEQTDDSVDSPCSEGKRALRPLHTRNVEHLKTMLSRPNAVSRVAVALTASCTCYA